VPDLTIFAVALLGLMVGSFLNVVIYRLPLMLDRQWQREARQLLSPGQEPPAETPFNLARPRSACPSCQTPIPARHNIPLLSFALLGGRCAACRTPIPRRYPLVEALSAVLSVLVVLHFGASLEGAAALLLCWSLIALTVIDLDHQILPDVITLPLLWLGLLLALIGEFWGLTAFPPLASSVMGAMGGYLSLWLVYQGFRLVTGKEGMGYGDFKLLGALGAWLGWQSLLPIILLSALVGAVTGIALIVLRGRDRQLPLPFGPFLAAAGFVVLLWGEPLRRLSGL
jgi:leader peptidase (prepilin peptidase) / N-methyltransferase